MAKQQPLVLLVDHEPDLCMLMQMTLSRIGIKTHLAYHLAQAKYFLSEYHYDACITDLNLPDGKGIDLVKHVTVHYPKTPIAVLTTYANKDNAISALKAGAFASVSKPINQQHFYQLIQKVLKVTKVDPSLEPLPLEQKMLIGQSSFILKLRESTKKIAQSQAPVFISGESGTGKDIVAHLVHLLSHRHNSPFIAINCGAISEELMESEFFGHIKGCFFGATEDKKGLIQTAHGGSLFLNEVAELSLPMQAKLLRAVQEKKIRPLGSEKEIEVDFRIISASHQDLELLVQQGKFRQDLFFRIHVMDLHIIPLRERTEDIAVLAQHFIQIICENWQIPIKKLSPMAIKFLSVQHFSGNVRELRNLLERAITLCDNELIETEQLQSSATRKVVNLPLVSTQDQEDCQSQNNAKLNSIPRNILPTEGLEQYLEKVEKEVLINALNLTHWNRTLAAKKLGMTFRSLRYRLKKFGLDTND